MINLLPLKQQKFLKKQFTIRVFVFISGMILASLVLYFLALIPTYIILDSQIKILENEKKIIDSRANEDEYRLVFDQVKDINDKIVEINSYYSSRNGNLEFLTDILEKKEVGIVVNKISIINEDSVLEATVEGIADNREILSDYISNLRFQKPQSYEITKSEFLSVTVPIINFTDSENISYSFNIKYGQKK